MEKKSFIGNLREYWKNPRDRSIIILGMYILFFAIIMIYARIGVKTPVPVEEEPVDSIYSFASMDNYEYYYEVEALKGTEFYSYTVSGIRYDNQDNFEILDNKFYIDNNVIYSSDGKMEITDICQFDLLLLRPDRLYQFIEKSTNINKIEYENGEIKTIYTVPVKEFNIAFLQQIPEDNTNSIEIITYEKDSQVYKIDIDILNLMKLVESHTKSYTIEITYSNIDNIKKVEELEK